MSKKVIWIDTETTGLDYMIHGLREVAAIIEIDGIMVDNFTLHIDTNSYFNKKCISDYVEKHMGVTDEVLSKYPSSLDQYRIFIQTIQHYVHAEDDSRFMISGYNVDFDVDFIKGWFNDIGVHSFNDYFGYQKLDVLELVRHLRYLDKFECENNQLETVCNHFGIEIDAHQALSDITATKALHEELVRRYIKG